MPYVYQRQTAVEGPGFTGYMIDEAETIKSFDYGSIYRSKQFQEAMTHFDVTDDMTRKILLSVNEADQNVVMQGLCNKLYNHIVEKVDDIDFGTIPSSKGDITKIDKYAEITDCLNIMTDILTQYRQDTYPVEVVTTAVQNMVDRIDFFTKAYRLNVEMPMIIYNTIALAIVSSTSFMISSCIEFIKLPNDQGFDIAVDKAGVVKAKQHLVYNDLDKWNKLCASGEFDRAMEYIMQGNANKFVGGTFAITASTAVVALGIILLIIPVIRELIFFFYYSRAKASDYFDAQANLLLLNSYNIENNLTRDEKSRKEIAKKQRAVVDTFRKISDSIKIKSKKAEQDTAKDIKKLDAEKYKHTDVLDSIPDSSNSVLF